MSKELNNHALGHENETVRRPAPARAVAAFSLRTENNAQNDSRGSPPASAPQPEVDRAVLKDRVDSSKQQTRERIDDRIAEQDDDASTLSADPSLKSKDSDAKSKGSPAKDSKDTKDSMLKDVSDVDTGAKAKDSKKDPAERTEQVPKAKDEPKSPKAPQQDSPKDTDEKETPTLKPKDISNRSVDEIGDLAERTTRDLEEEEDSERSRARPIDSQHSTPSLLSRLPFAFAGRSSEPKDTRDNVSTDWESMKAVKAEMETTEPKAASFAEASNGNGKAETLTEKAKEKFQNAKESLQEAKENLQQKARNAVEKAKGTMQDKDDAADDEDENDEAAEDMKEKAKSAKDSAQEKAKSMKETVQEKAKDLKESAQEKAKEMKETVQEKAKDAKEAVHEKAKEVKESLQGKAKDAKEAADEKLKDAKESAKDAKDAVDQKAKDAKATFEEKAKDAKDAAAAKAKETKETVEAKAKDAKDALEQKTKPSAKEEEARLRRERDSPREQTMGTFASIKQGIRNWFHKDTSADAPAEPARVSTDENAQRAQQTSGASRTAIASPVGGGFTPMDASGQTFANGDAPEPLDVNLSDIDRAVYVPHTVHEAVPPTPQGFSKGLPDLTDMSEPLAQAGVLLERGAVEMLHRRQQGTSNMA